MVKILYVDDNESMLKLFQLLGEEHGFTALTAQTIEQSIDIALTQKPDVILLDIHLGPSDADGGWRLVAALKSHEHLSRIPVIGCSVTYHEEGRRMASLAGVRFINDKPYSLEKLNQILAGIFPPILEK